jgi:hypothetical protein
VQQGLRKVIGLSQRLPEFRQFAVCRFARRNVPGEPFDGAPAGSQDVLQVLADEAR